jgi:hypothetical protein
MTIYNFWNFLHGFLPDNEDKKIIKGFDDLSGTVYTG